MLANRVSSSRVYCLDLLTPVAERAGTKQSSEKMHEPAVQRSQNKLFKALTEARDTFLEILDEDSLKALAFVSSEGWDFARTSP